MLIPLLRVFRQSSLMNCWFYAAKTVVFTRTLGRTMLIEADFLGLSPPPAYPVTMGRGAGIPSWLGFGLPPQSFPQFAGAFHFAQPASRPSTWTTHDMEEALRQYGPLWFGGANGNAHHVVVINGITGSTVNYGDPATGNNHTCTLAQFNNWKQQRPDLWNPMYYPRR